MFTKKLEDQFSADLLNTVKGVLGEAKHDKECECEKCEDEEEDDEKEDKKKEMKEGKTGLWANIHAKRKRIKAGSGERMRKPGSEGAPTNADFKAASESVEVEEGLDKKHPIVKEYDSLKKHDIKTLRGMISRNSRVVDTSEFKTKDHAISHLLRQKHGHKKVDQAFGFNEEVEQIDETPKSAAELIKNKIKKAEANAKARDPHTKIERDEARVGRMLAAKARQRNEEVEQIDEISKATMGRYINKAKDQIDAASYRQGHRDSRGSGGDPVAKGIERKLSKRHGGIELAVKKLTKEDAEQIDELSKDTMGRYINKAADRMSTQGVTAGLKIAADEKTKKNFDSIGKRQKGIARAVSKLTKEEQDFIDALNDADIEQIDEISKGTAMKALQHVSSDPDDERGYTLQKKIGKKWPEMKGHAAAASRTAGYGRSDRNIFQDRDKLADRAKTSYRMTKDGKANKQDLKARFRKEEVELEEGRGRPPKEGTPAWHAKQKQASDDMVALGMQLRKAKSMNKKVRFMDNKEHEVSAHHADRFEDHMAARKTSQDKAAFQKQAHKSHADFVKAVSAPVPKANKDTGEIVKYRH